MNRNRMHRVLTKAIGENSANRDENMPRKYERVCRFLPEQQNEQNVDHVTATASICFDAKTGFIQLFKNQNDLCRIFCIHIAYKTKIERKYKEKIDMRAFLDFIKYKYLES